MRHPFRKILKHFSFCKIPWSLTLDVSHTRTLCLSLWVTHYPAFKPHRNFFFCVIKWKYTKRFLGGSFQLVLALGIICVNKMYTSWCNFLRLGQWLKGLPTNLRFWSWCLDLGRKRLYTSVSACYNSWFYASKMKRMYCHKFAHSCSC